MFAEERSPGPLDYSSPGRLLKRVFQNQKESTSVPLPRESELWEENSLGLLMHTEFACCPFRGRWEADTERPLGATFLLQLKAGSGSEEGVGPERKEQSREHQVILWTWS